MFVKPFFFMFASFAVGKRAKDKIVPPVVSKLLVPKTLQQCTYLSHLNDPQASIVVGLGSAGTGKTLFACHSAIQHLKTGEFEKIVITRPSVCVDEDIGFLPGNVLKKMDPFTRPIFDIFSDYYSMTELNYFIQNNVVEVSTLGFMRGRTFKNSFIVADEMQNSSPSQMKMLLTRLGENSRLVITGDLKQSDYGLSNGLADFCSKLEGKVLPNIQVVKFSDVDIQRSLIVSTIVKLYEKDGGE